jgi:hypothetical protein
MFIRSIGVIILLITTLKIAETVERPEPCEFYVDTMNWPNSADIRRDFINKHKEESTVGMNYDVYAGAAYEYSLRCGVKDDHTQPGDKYYVLDVLVYGPNRRVAKAWRSQFASRASIASVVRKISFRSLGKNSVICAVSKYNSIKNKFSNVCQSTRLFNVTEIENNKQVYSNKKQVDLSSKDLISKIKSMTLQNEANSIQENEDIDEDYLENVRGKGEEAELEEEEEDEVSIQNKQTTATTTNNNKLLLVTEKIQKRKMSLIKPWPIILTLLAVFALSICTIIFLACYLKKDVDQFHHKSILKLRKDNFIKSTSPATSSSLSTCSNVANSRHNIDQLDSNDLSIELSIHSDSRCLTKTKIINDNNENSELIVTTN